MKHCISYHTLDILTPTVLSRPTCIDNDKLTLLLYTEYVLKPKCIYQYNVATYTRLNNIHSLLSEFKCVYMCVYACMRACVRATS